MKKQKAIKVHRPQRNGRWNDGKLTPDKMEYGLETKPWRGGGVRDIQIEWTPFEPEHTTPTGQQAVERAEEKNLSFAERYGGRGRVSDAGVRKFAPSLRHTPDSPDGDADEKNEEQGGRILWGRSKAFSHELNPGLSALLNDVLHLDEQLAGQDPDAALHRKRSAQYDVVVEDAKALFMRKNKEYGDAISVNGVLGAVIEMAGISGRMHQMFVHPLPTSREDLELALAQDKLLSREERDAALVEKFTDAINYGIIGLIMLREGNLTGAR